MSSILGARSMGTPFFHELKSKASFFLKEKIKTARLALTDVTPAELLTEEVTTGSPWVPDTRTMGLISRMAFEVDDYWRIVAILHKRLSRFDRKQWREPYNALILLEHLLTHGPESVATEFQSDGEVIEEMGTFQYIDEKGFNWGLVVRKKSERVLKLLEKGPLLREERDRARKVTRGIQGFGSFNLRWSSTTGGNAGNVSDYFRKSNSHYEDFSGQEDVITEDQKENTESDDRLDDSQMEEHAEARAEKSLLPRKGESTVEVGTEGLSPEESKPLLAWNKEGPKIEFQKEDHQLNDLGNQNVESLLLLSHS